LIRKEKMLDYYKILGVPPQATEKDIKAAYRKLAKEYHPDVVQDDPDGNKKMYEIQEAYGVLGDAEKRKQYDSFRKEKKERGTTKREDSREQREKPGNAAPDMSQFERFFGFQPGKGMETYRGNGDGAKKHDGPVNTNELFSAFFGVKK
jgi:DnaJ-class molecular chaperone